MALNTDTIIYNKCIIFMYNIARPIPLQLRGRLWGNAYIQFFFPAAKKSCVPIRLLGFDYAR